MKFIKFIPVLLILTIGCQLHDPDGNNVVRAKQIVETTTQLPAKSINTIKDASIATKNATITTGTHVDRFIYVNIKRVTNFIDNTRNDVQDWYDENRIYTNETLVTPSRKNR